MAWREWVKWPLGHFVDSEWYDWMGVGRAPPHFCIDDVTDFGERRQSMNIVPKRSKNEGEETKRNQAAKARAGPNRIGRPDREVEFDNPRVVPSIPFVHIALAYPTSSRKSQKTKKSKGQKRSPQTYKGLRRRRTPRRRRSKTTTGAYAKKSESATGDTPPAYPPPAHVHSPSTPRATPRTRPPNAARFVVAHVACWPQRNARRLVAVAAAACGWEGGMETGDGEF